jgi:hypothetical protein
VAEGVGDGERRRQNDKCVGVIRSVRAKPSDATRAEGCAQVACGLCAT